VELESAEFKGVEEMKLERVARFLFVPLIGGACAFAIACGGDEPTKPAAKSAKAPMPRSQRERLPEPSVKDTLAADIDLPDYYPDDAPIYRGATVNSSGWQSGRVNVVFSTADAPSDVSGDVQSSLRSKGWGEIVEAEMVNGVVVQAEKGSRSISALISRMEGGTGDETTMIIVAVDP